MKPLATLSLASLLVCACRAPIPVAAPAPPTSPFFWSALPPLPGARWGAAEAAGLDGRIYVFGGTTTGGGNTSPPAQAFDPSSSTWSAIAPLGARYYTSAARGRDGRIYIVGGQTDQTDTGFTATVVGYDPATNAYSHVASMGSPRGGAAVTATLDGKIYAIGGVAANYGYNETAEVFTPADGAWHPIARPAQAHFWGAAAAGIDGRSTRSRASMRLGFQRSSKPTIPQPTHGRAWRACRRSRTG